MCSEEQEIIQQIREIKSFLSFVGTLYKFSVASEKDWYNARAIYEDSAARCHARWHDVMLDGMMCVQQNIIDRR